MVADSNTYSKDKLQQQFSSSLFILYIDVFAHWRGGEVRDSEDRESHNGLKNIFEGSLHEESCFKNLGGIQ